MNKQTLTQTDHDYGRCLRGNFYSSDPNGRYDSWADFKEAWYGFACADPTFDRYDDTYNFLFRYDIHEAGPRLYQLELCFMLQRKGIYSRILVDGITQDDLDRDIYTWLQGRKRYMMELWAEV